MSFGDIAAQALSGVDGEEDVEKQIEQALSCPCVGDLKEGPCGATFVGAFSCFIRSNHEDKGMDCIPQFQNFQSCLKENPGVVGRILGEAENSESEKTKEP